MCLTDLGANLKKQKRAGEAEPILKRALSCAEELNNPMHATVAWALKELAEFYYNRQRYKEALPLIERSLQCAGSQQSFQRAIVMWRFSFV